MYVEEVVSLYGKLLSFSFLCSGSKTALKKIVYELKKKKNEDIQTANI